MSRVYLVLSLILLVLVALFATINASEVTVNLFWIRELKTTVAMLVISALVIGIVFMALIDLFRQFRAGREIARLKKELKAAEQERELMKNRIKELGGKDSGTGSRGGPS
jgi:uncharacterized integral membrane protein